MRRAEERFYGGERRSVSEMSQQRTDDMAEVAISEAKPSVGTLSSLLPKLAVTLAVAGVARYLYSAVYQAVINEAWGDVRGQSYALREYLWHGQSVAETMSQLQVSQMRYGPVFFLVTHPLALLGANDRALELLLLGFAHLCFWLTVYLIDRRFLSSSPWPVRLLFVGVALNYTPILVTLATKTLDMWEMMFIAMGLYLLASPSSWQRRVAGVPVMLGVFTKMMPVLVFVFVVTRSRIAGAIGLFAGAIALTMGHLLYGPVMGWGFLLRVPDIINNRTFPEALWWPNSSLRGIVYKILNGFHLPAGLPRPEWYLAVDPESMAVANAGLVILSVAVLVFVGLKLWRWQPLAELEPIRLLGGFALAVVLVPVFAPFSTEQYYVSSLIAFVFLLRCAQLGHVSRTEGYLALVALFLVGGILPRTVFVLLSGTWLLNMMVQSAPDLMPIEVHLFYGLPGMGLLILTVIVMRVQWRLVQKTPVKPTVAAVGPRLNRL